MSNENSKFTGIGNLDLTVVRPTQLGKKAADMTLQITKPALRLFKMEEGMVKVPRKRASADSKYEEKYGALFDALEAPKMVYIWTDGETQKQVEWNEEGNVFVDEEGNQYDNEHTNNIMEYGATDARAITGTMEALTQLKNAVTWYNNRHKGNKRLATRFVKATRDKSGRTIEQTEEVYRVR